MLGQARKLKIPAPPCVSMGEGMEIVGSKAIDAGAENGTWVMLENCELGMGLMVEMEDMMAKLKENVHPNCGSRAARQGLPPRAASSCRRSAPTSRPRAEGGPPPLVYDDGRPGQAGAHRRQGGGQDVAKARVRALLPAPPS